MRKLILMLLAAGALAAATAATAAAPTVTLQTDRSTIIYGGSATLSGNVSPVTAGQSVTITETQLAHAKVTRTLMPDNDGNFTLNLYPRANALVDATYNGGTSDQVNIFVRPRVSLSKYGKQRYAVRVTAARPFVGRYVWITRWGAKAHAWKNVMRVRLAHYVKSSGASTATFRLRTRSHTKLRVFLNNVAARPDYVKGWSNFVVSS